MHFEAFSKIADCRFQVSLVAGGHSRLSESPCPFRRRACLAIGGERRLDPAADVDLPAASAPKEPERAGKAEAGVSLSSRLFAAGHCRTKIVVLLLQSREPFGLFPPC